MSDLFTDLPQSLSPRLKWMERHGITITLQPVSEHVVGEDEVWLAHLPRPHAYGRGKTEDEALTALAQAAGIRMWFEEESPAMPIKVFNTPDSGEMAADPNGDPRCPDCNGQVMKCGIDTYKCRKCGEGWTITPTE